ncbi:PKD domain-containing protein [Anaeromyxobacter paludicola]|uniref:PKD domain-containing protein n=1 Tax=Anaeromyxobacter paludicola TaxID=2918171 RepID=A0ABM7XDC1_9BACT|nr:PKD domain-containing protein [Anaeromyxobacter paludicola]BDG09876.1 hypothetical protein AMPC_29890 [Anaeromyxobacter paludicola]
MTSPGGLRARAAGVCLFALLAACGSGERQLKTCTTDADCGAGVCFSGVCAADNAPSAAIGGAPSSGLAAGEQLVLDGTGSSDPDRGDAVTAYAWSVTGGDCAAVPSWSTQPRLDTVFSCTGTYTVALVVTDAHGRQSAPASVVLAVSASGSGTTGGTNSNPSTDVPPPTVAAGDDLALEHTCQGSPLVCTPVTDSGSQVVRLSAAGHDAYGEPVSYHWSYEPPAGLSGLPAPKVEFFGGTEGAQAEVRISTAGTPLSGDWRFFVTVTDARGKRARDEVVVTVKDRPVRAGAGSQLAVPHHYDPAARRYVAEGTAPVQFTEPDGDTLRFTAALETSRPTSCTLATDAAAGGMHFRVECPTLAELTQGDLTHVLAFTGTDPAGSSATTRFPLTVLDQVPTASSPQAGTTLSPTHSYDAQSRRYWSEIAVDVTASDPEGDPTTLGWSLQSARATGCALEPSVTDGHAVVRIGCADLRDLVGTDVRHVVVASVSDGDLAIQLAFHLSPQNSAPRVSEGVAQSLPHAYDPVRQRYTTEFSAPLAASDPDGDPLTVTCADEPSRAHACAFVATVEGGAVHVQLACQDPLELTGAVAHVTACTVGDGSGATARSTFPMLVGNRPPVVTAPPLAAFDHFVDLPGAPRSYRVQGSQPLQVVDPDGDPVTSDFQVEVDAAWAPHAAAAVSAGGDFQLEVPIAWPGELRHADDSSPFTLVSTGRDPWEAVQVRTSVRVKDRAPVLTTASPSVVPVAHSYDGTGYRTQPELVSGIWIDPDGDPLQAAATSSGVCARMGVVASGGGYQVTGACDLAWSVAQGGLPPLATFAQAQPLSYAVQDAWGLGGAGSTTLAVLDRAPGATLAFSACVPRTSSCRAYDPGSLQLETWTEKAASSFTGTPVGSDPDGDPVQVTWKATVADAQVPGATCVPVGGTSATCAPGAPCASLSMGGCEVHLTQGNCQAEVAGTTGIEVTDGVVGLSVTAPTPTCP